MKLRIFVDQGRNELTGICGHELSYGKNGIQDKSPDLVRDRQLKAFLRDFPEDSADCLIRLEPLDRAEDVVLHHCQCEAGYLRSEVNGLALSQIEQGLHVVIDIM